MKKIFLAVAVLFIFVNQVWAGVDGSIFADKIQTTVRAESWGNEIAKDVEYGWYGKVNVPRVGDTNFFGEGQIDYLPIKIGLVKFGVEANMQVAYPSDTELLGRGYLAAKVGPFLLRYSPIQTDGNHKLSVCWFQKWNKFSIFGYYDRNLNKGQKPLNIAEGYIGYDITKNVMFMVGTKPVWNDGKNPDLYMGGGIRVNLW